MKLSIVIPTYNRKDSLRITLDGLSRQQYPCADFEVVVVSDGSTDGTAEMLAEYEQTSPYSIRAVCQTNGGPAKARNRGIQEAQHEVVVFLDDDVEPEPEFLSRHAMHHQQNAKIAVIGPMSPDPARSAQEPVWIAWEHDKLQNIYAMFRPGGRYAGCPAGSMHFYSGNASVRKEWLLAIDGFDENYTRQEDVELAVRLQHTCGVTFLFDFAADGIHRPSRSYEAWLRIPKAYGAFDKQRVADGLLRPSEIISNLKKRNTVTRGLASLCLACPWLIGPTEGILRRFAIEFYRMGQKFPALAALSALYNICYILASVRPKRGEQEIVKMATPPQPCDTMVNGTEDVQEDVSVVRILSSPAQDLDSRSFSVLICTCNRKASIVRTVQTIFAADSSCEELIVIDQSDTDETRIALTDFLDDPRLCYVHTTIKGKAKALNCGLQLACCNIVAITDDDIEVQPTWPQYHLDAFEKYPNVVMTYGSVWPVDYDHSKGFIPVYETTHDRLVTNMWQKLLARGIGANMAVRRSAILEMGGFDPTFGPGGLFKASEDFDMSIRCVLHGHHIYEVHQSQVYHNGFRNWDQARTLVCNSFYAMGALHIKAVLGGRGSAVIPLIWEFLAYALLPSVWATITFRRPAGWKRVFCFLHGARDGMRYPIDKKQLLFKI